MLCIDNREHKEGDQRHTRNTILLRHVVETHSHDITRQDILNADNAYQDKFKEYLFAKCDKRKLLSKGYISNGIFAASLPVNTSVSRYAKIFPNYDANIGEFSPDLPQLTSDLVEMPKVESNHRCGDFITSGVITACFITGALYAYTMLT